MKTRPAKRGFFARLLSRLSVGRKLLLIYLLDLSAVIFISGILVQEKYIAIDFARKELVGSAYLSVANDALTLVARPAPSIAEADRLRQSARTIQVAESRWGADMGSRGAAEAASSTLDRLSMAVASTGGVARKNDIIPVRALATRQARELITLVGNQSNLILDPDLDSYYTMSIVLLRYPELVDVVSQIGDLVGASTGTATALSPADRARYFILEGRLIAVLQGIQSDHVQAFAGATDGQLKAALAPQLAALTSSVEGFRALSGRYVDENGPATMVAPLERAQTDLLDRVAAAWPVAGSQLDRLLHARVDMLFKRMWLHLSTALFLLMCLLSAVFFVARQITRPLSRLSDVAERVRLSGDYTLRAEGDSADEIGKLVVAFNGMLERLDQHRQLQQELVATASAASAQQQLIETMPIALMVTSIPDHDVLHANGQARLWLSGKKSDPWASGFDKGVGPRFFQELADRNMVDQFEVRWEVGATRQWAVLSARRLEYQGRDAVLTAFTPIGHLKQMEQRLALWSKVFEASSEGIVITDAHRRIVTVNPSFCRSAGHDLVDLAGTNPEDLLAREESKDHVDDIWPVASRGRSWRGEVRVRRRDDRSFPAWLAVDAVHDESGVVSHFIWTIQDITEQKATEERIHFLAHHDPLTRLPNRQLFAERLRMAMQTSRRRGEKVAVLLIDLDRFKTINDSLGHHAGDALLRSVSQRLQEGVRANDTVCRLGGDEFVIALNGVTSGEEVLGIIDQRLMPRIRDVHDIDGSLLHVSCSIGVSVFPDDATDIDVCMRHADVAMYQAKTLGRDGVQFFTAELNEKAHARLRIEQSLRHAIEREELSLHYQPLVSAKTGEMLGVEALLRWNSSELGAVSPGEFIPVAEESRLITRIGAWVVEQACRQQAQWRDAGHGEICIAINVSAVQLGDPSLQAALQESMRNWSTTPGTIELELTESTLMRDVNSVLAQLTALKRLGVRLAIDDFGTGYSSLSYLHRFPIDRLKIDRSFIGRMLEDPADLAITRAIIGLGHTLGLQVVAEGVEGEEVAAALRFARCDELQGFLYSPGLPAAELVDWLSAWRSGDKSPSPALAARRASGDGS